jgi:hypothetical protein
MAAVVFFAFIASLKLRMSSSKSGVVSCVIRKSPMGRSTRVEAVVGSIAPQQNKMDSRKNRKFFKIIRLNSLSHQ